MINCVPKFVASVETQAMPVVVESVSSPTNSVSMCANTNSSKTIRYRNFCRKIETLSKNCVDQNEVQKYRSVRNYVVRPRYACVY